MLTNSLEPPSSNANFTADIQQLTFFNDPLAAEAYDADKTKNNPGINVIIGNPPYSGISSNNNEYITKLIDDYKYIEGEYFNEKKHWLNDDYVKFIRYAEEVISKNGNGVLAFINNNGFLGNPTFRCMRYHLLKNFNSIYIINLHGDSNKHETCPDGSKDENVFDIKQGVSINIFVKKQSVKNELPKVKYYDVFGLREYKNQILVNNHINYSEIKPTKPFYLFQNVNLTNSQTYTTHYISINELFNVSTTGIVTARDDLVIDEKKEQLLKKIEIFVNPSASDNDIRKIFFQNKKDGKYLAGDSRGWSLSQARKSILQNKHSEYVTKIAYRPFDNRYIYNSEMMVDWLRPKVICHFTNFNNIGLITARSNKSDDCSHFYISRYMSEAKCGERTTQSAIFPLYLYSEEMGKTVRTPNLNSEIVKEISDKLGLPFAPDSDGGNTDSFAPIDLLDYIYAVLHSPKYRETYKEFLKIDFPRVPYPTDKEMFWKMVKLGGEIRKLHLMESPLLDTLITRFPLNGSNEVEKITRKENRVYINKTQYFDGISDLAWNFYIGGYQPLQKWLKDRKGRTLSDEDIIHYQKIAVALTETDRLMKEIDEVFIFGEDIENVKV